MKFDFGFEPTIIQPFSFVTITKLKKL